MYAPRIFAMGRFVASQHVQFLFPRHRRLLNSRRVFPQHFSSPPPHVDHEPAAVPAASRPVLQNRAVRNARHRPRQLLVALDQTVVSTALPSIVAELHGFEFYAWIASAYLLAYVVTVPVFGRLGDYFGRKPFVIAAVITFTVASVLCGLAPNMLFLALARGLQGVGGGMMVGTAFAAIPDLFPDARTRVRWQMVLAAYGIGTAAGPSLGGWMSQHWGWRSTFLVNLPVGAAALYFIWSHLPNMHRRREGGVKIDWLGTALVAVVLGGFQALIEALPKDGLSTNNLVLGAVVIVAAGALLICEKRDPLDHSARHLPRSATEHAVYAVVPRGFRDVLADLFRAGFDASALFDAARDALVQSIHIGTMLTAVAALVSALLVRRISHIVFRKVGTGGGQDGHAARALRPLPGASSTRLPRIARPMERLFR